MALNCFLLLGQQRNRLDSLVAKADLFYTAKNYDSALIYNLTALKWLGTHKPEEYQVYLSPAIMLFTGRCYLKKNNVQDAHKYLYYSLHQSRVLDSKTDMENAFTELNYLHNYISIHDLSFSYPLPPVTEEVKMFFPITKVDYVSADSIRITIRAGKYDGITDSVKKGGIISKYGDKTRPFGLVNGYLQENGNNYCTAMAINDSTRKVLEGDLIELTARVPAGWRKLDVNQSLLYSISFLDNYKTPIFDPRYLYYYSDSLTNAEIMIIMKSQVDGIVEDFAADTATNKAYTVKGEKGIFAGENVMKAMSHSTERDMRLFMGFVYEYPRKYIGSPFKFSEVFATWVVNNTPLALADIRPFLVSQPNSAARQKISANLSEDILKNEMIGRWFNEGMLMANADNIDSAKNVAQTIRDASIALDDMLNKGWATYLDGYIEKKSGNYARADSLFKKAITEFKAGKNSEGENWAISALRTLGQNRKIELSVQTGHLFPYIIAVSPNSKFLATGGNYDRFIKIWDLGLGKEVKSFIAHNDYINSLHYSPNGRYIVSSSDDNTIKIWNAYDYSLVKTFKTKKPELEVIFSPDSKSLVTGGTDSLVKFMDLNTGAITSTFKKHTGSVTSLFFLPNSSQWLFSAGADSMMYKWNLETGKWNHWYKEKGRILNITISNDGKYLATVRTDSLIGVWNLETDKTYFTATPNISKGAATDYAFPSFTADSKYLALALSNDTLSMIELSTLKTRVYGIRTHGDHGLFDLVFTPDGNSLAARLNDGGPLRIYNFSGWDFNNRPTINFRDMENYFNIPLEVQFSKDDNQLFIVHAGVSAIDLRNGSTNFLYFGALGFQNPYILLNDEKTGLYTDTHYSYLKFFNYVDRSFPLKLSFPDTTEIMTRFELSANNRYLYMGSKKNTVAGFELPTGKPLFSKTFDAGGVEGLNFLRYDSLRKRIYLVGKDDKIIIADAITGKELGFIIASKPATIEFNKQYLYITCDKSLLHKYDASTFKLVKKIKVHSSGRECYGSVMSGDYKILLVQVADKFVAIDTRTDKILYEKYDHDYENGIMTISHNNKMLATGGFDSKVNLYDLQSGNKLATIYTPREKDFMIADMEGHYLAPKNTLEAVSFNFNNSSYGFEQFDTRFNRPDLVLTKLGKADSNLVKTFYAAYQKRLKKLHISEKDAGSDFHLPIIRLKDKFALKSATPLSEYELNIECSDSKYPLRSVQVLVNNNPIFGTAGQIISGNQYHYSLKVKVPLSMGNNMVKVYCINSKGTMSLAEALEINSSNKPVVPSKTYFIGIAVSNYKDSSMNLRFAAKDVRDLSEMFRNIKRKVDDYEADTLIDANATKEKILALREKLMNTKVDDRVIISVNGHGLLNENKDFYYGTYDIDFNDPASRGLKYEELEALLDGIPARKKLLLIDACHSGALDKEEIIAQQKKDTVLIKKDAGEKGMVTSFVARGTIIQSAANSTDAGSAYEIMQNMFADLSAGNGAIIISASGGMEYAFESDTWNNGVFTYCIRKAIEDEQADKDGGDDNKLVEVGELKNYVSRKVRELTNGKQRPMSRRENIEFNWIIW